MFPSPEVRWVIKKLNQSYCCKWQLTYCSTLHVDNPLCYWGGPWNLVKFLNETAVGTYLPKHTKEKKRIMFQHWWAISSRQRSQSLFSTKMFSVSVCQKNRCLDQQQNLRKWGQSAVSHLHRVDTSPLQPYFVIYTNKRGVFLYKISFSISLLLR